MDLLRSTSWIWVGSSLPLGYYLGAPEDVRRYMTMPLPRFVRVSQRYGHRTFATLCSEVYPRLMGQIWVSRPRSRDRPRAAETCSPLYSASVTLLYPRNFFVLSRSLTFLILVHSRHSLFHPVPR